jgi:thiamine-phosphate pyrophosphorylase
MLVAGRPRKGRLVDTVTRAHAAGLRLVQLREPDLDDDALARLVETLRAAAPGVTWILNDRPRLAAALGLGLHLPERRPRCERGDRSIACGRSVHDESAALAARDEGARWIVLGTIFPTPSKPGHPGAGCTLVRRVARLVAPVPVFAIGGVSETTAGALREAGAHGVAVCRAILDATDPGAATAGLLSALHGASNADAGR